MRDTPGRNLSDADKMDLAEIKREIIEASQPKGGRPPNDGAKEPTQNCEPVSPKDDRKTDAKIGKIAGVSRDTVMKYRAGV